MILTHARILELKTLIKSSLAENSDRWIARAALDLIETHEHTHNLLEDAFAQIGDNYALSTSEALAEYFGVTFWQGEYIPDDKLPREYWQWRLEGIEYREKLAATNVEWQKIPGFRPEDLKHHREKIELELSKVKSEVTDDDSN